MTTGRWIDALDGASVVTPVSDTESSRAFSGRSCGRREHCAERNEIDRLYRSLDEVTPESHPRTAKLLASSKRKVAQKVFEEAGEVALEAVRHNARGIVQESADLLYNLVALWYRAGIRPDDVWAEMRCRAEGLGIAEKLPKKRDRDDHAFRSAAKRIGGDDEGSA